jgi:hypothetical protein
MALIMRAPAKEARGRCLDEVAPIDIRQREVDLPVQHDRWR